MLVVWLFAIPVGSTNCILIHSRAQERDRLILEKPDCQDTRATDTNPACSACDSCIIWPPPAPGWLAFDPRKDLLLDTCWTEPMTWAHSRVRSETCISKCSSVGSGVGPGKESPFSLAGESGPSPSWMLIKDEHFSSVAHSHLGSIKDRVHVMFYKLNDTSCKLLIYWTVHIFEDQ